MPTTINDYERRFQRSLQKLTVPTWYAETILPSKLSTTSKQSIISSTIPSTTSTSTPWKNNCRDSSRTPEIVHIRRPHSYRSCRSSLATSPSPSIHSWHPNHIFDGMNFSLAIPSSSVRRQNKYQKGIERVSKSSRWYRPTSFTPNGSNQDQTGKKKSLSHPSSSQLYIEHPSLKHMPLTLELSITRSLIVIVACMSWQCKNISIIPCLSHYYGLSRDN